jgi:hypothetical protein
MNAIPAGWGYREFNAEKVSPTPKKPKAVTCREIVSALLADSAILDLCDAALVRNIKARFGCAQSTAYRAIQQARESVA